MQARPAAANELTLTFADERAERSWSDEPSIFTRARKMGIDAILIGWYHPYCRVLGDRVARCRSYAKDPGAPETVQESLRIQLALGLNTIPGVARLRPVERLGRVRLGRRMWHAAQYRAIHQDALDAVIDQRVGLVFVHYPVPHTPFIFDRATNSILPSRAGSYTDELALVDLTLGELRLALEGAGLWDTTALIVTSDHWRRRPGWKRRPRETFPTIGRPDHRVPLILRFPGQREAVLEQRPIHSAAAHTFALAILDGQLQTPAHIEAVVATLPRWIRLDSRQASD